MSRDAYWNRHRAQQEANDDEALRLAAELDPNDHSTRAEQIREAAEDVRDHRGQR